MMEGPMAVINIQLNDLERQRKTALDNAESNYYNFGSPHFGDNERFTWAVQAINKKFNQLKQDCRESYENKTT